MRLVASFMVFSILSCVSFKNRHFVIQYIETGEFKPLMQHKAIGSKLFYLPQLNFMQCKLMATDFIIVLVTTKDQAEAKKISQTLVEEKLIACANIVSPVASCFWWMGKVERAQECLVVMKTKADLFGEVAARVKALHSYEVPEVLALPIVEGSADYLAWLRASLKS